MSQMQLVGVDETLNIVLLSGRLDSEHVVRLEVGLTAALSGSGKDAILDVGQVEFCGSLAIRMFLGVARSLQREGRRLVLAGAKPKVQDVFESISLGRIIPIAPTTAEARALLGA
jgi:anti-anti-sigma factor